MVCEPFTQWVLEDRFGQGRPPFEDAGRADGRRRRPLRADEAAAAQRQPPGAVLPRLPRRATATRTRSARTPSSRTSCSRYMEREGSPDAAAGARGSTSTPTAASSSTASPTPRCATRWPGSAPRARDRIPKWLVPVIREQPPRPGARSSGPRWWWPRGRATPRAWTSRASRSRWSTASRTGSWRQRPGRRRTPLAFIRDRDLFGDLADDERFTAAYTAALDALHTHGARATLESRAGLDRSATPDQRPATESPPSKHHREHRWIDREGVSDARCRPEPPRRGRGRGAADAQTGAATRSSSGSAPWACAAPTPTTTTTAASAGSSWSSRWCSATSPPASSRRSGPRSTRRGWASGSPSSPACPASPASSAWPVATTCAPTWSSTPRPRSTARSRSSSVIHEAFAHPVPDSISDEAAALLEPLSVGVWSCRKGGVGPRHLGAGHRRRPDRAGRRAGRAGGRCREVVVADVNPHRLAVAADPRRHPHRRRPRRRAWRSRMPLGPLPTCSSSARGIRAPRADGIRALAPSGTGGPRGHGRRRVPPAPVGRSRSASSS